MVALNPRIHSIYEQTNRTDSTTNPPTHVGRWRGVVYEHNSFTCWCSEARDRRDPIQASQFAEWVLTPARSDDTDRCETHARTHCAPNSRRHHPTHSNIECPPASRRRAALSSAVTWLILPVVICLSQRLSHACLSISIVQRNCRRLIKTVMVYLMVHCYLDNRSNSRANTCTKERLTKLCIY